MWKRISNLKKIVIFSAAFTAVILAGLLSMIIFTQSMQKSYILQSYILRDLLIATPERRSPAPFHSLNRRMDKELQQAWKELKDGKIAYEPSRTMTEGEPEKVLVRIAQGDTIDAKSKFVDSVWVECLKVSGFMSASLSADHDDFEIVPLSSESQALVGASTDWVWRVTPLRSGNLALNVKVTARIRLSDGSSEHHDLLVKDAHISVRANPRWRAIRFWKRNWQVILGSPIVLGLLAWLGTRLLKKRAERRIGF
jgi:hypothetical protein